MKHRLVAEEELIKTSSDELNHNER